MTIQLQTSFTKDDVEIVEKSTAFKGFFQLDQVLLKHRLFEGGWSEKMSVTDYIKSIVIKN